jgi:hypothetical protein
MNRRKFLSFLGLGASAAVAAPAIAKLIDAHRSVEPPLDIPPPPHIISTGWSVDAPLQMGDVITFVDHQSQHPRKQFIVVGPSKNKLLRWDEVVEGARKAIARARIAERSNRRYHAEDIAFMDGDRWFE